LIHIDSVDIFLLLTGFILLILILFDIVVLRKMAERRLEKLEDFRHYARKVIEQSKKEIEHLRSNIYHLQKILSSYDMNIKVSDDLREDPATTKTDDVYIYPNEQAIPSDNITICEQVNDGRLWVRRTSEGVKLLERSESKSDLYLLKNGADFDLFITGSIAHNVNNLIKIYGSILEYPLSDARGKILMIRQPLYRELGGKFYFAKKGEFTIE
jgi:hypothetical protein